MGRPPPHPRTPQTQHHTSQRPEHVPHREATRRSRSLGPWPWGAQHQRPGRDPTVALVTCTPSTAPRSRSMSVWRRVSFGFVSTRADFQGGVQRNKGDRRWPRYEDHGAVALPRDHANRQPEQPPHAGIPQLQALARALPHERAPGIRNPYVPDIDHFQSSFGLHLLKLLVDVVHDVTLPTISEPGPPAGDAWPKGGGTQMLRSAGLHKQLPWP